jgi:hypothetical protein
VGFSVFIATLKVFMVSFVPWDNIVKLEVHNMMSFTVLFRIVLKSIIIPLMLRPFCSPKVWSWCKMFSLMLYLEWCSISNLRLSPSFVDNQFEGMIIKKSIGKCVSPIRSSLLKSIATALVLKKLFHAAGKDNH